MKKQFALYFFLVLFSTATIAQNNVNEYSSIKTTLEQIEMVVDKYIKEHQIPAISIGIVVDGKTTFIKKGIYNRKTNEKIDEHSSFQLASLSKTFTGIIINNLISEKKIDINESIVRYLPKDYSQKTQAKLRAITVRDLLHHRSGLPRDSKILRRKKKGNDAFIYDYTEEDFKKDFDKIKIKSPSGKEYRYSNFGYAVLGYIAEQVTAQSYASLLEQYILTPYQLSETHIDLKDVQHLVTPYRKENRYIETSPWIMGKLTPPSGIFSSTADLARLIQFQLEAYKEHKNVLMLTKDTRLRYPNTNLYYGYGFADWGNGALGHGGDMDGFSSDYSINPALQKGYIILTSSGGKWVPYLSMEIGKILYTKNE